MALPVSAASKTPASVGLDPLHEMRQARDKLQLEVAAAKEANEAKAKELASLQAQRRLQQEEIRMLGEIDRVSGEIAQRRKLLDQLESRIDALRSAETSDLEVTEMELDVQDLDGQVISKKSLQLSIKRDNLRKREQEERPKLADPVAALTKEKEKLEADLAYAKEVLDKLPGLIEKFQNNDKRFAAYSRRYSQALKDSPALDAALSDILIKLNSALRALNQFDSEHTQELDSISLAAAELENRRAAHAAKEAEFDLRHKKLENDIKTLAKLENLFATQVAIVVVLQKQLAGLQKQLSQIEAKKRHLNAAASLD